MSEPVQILIKFTDIDRTAQTPVAERDGGVAERSGHGHRVDLDRAEVVDDGSDATATAAVQEMVEQCGLAGTQEAGENDDRDLAGTRPTHHAPFLKLCVHRLTGPALTRGMNADPAYEWGNRPEVNDC